MATVGFKLIHFVRLFGVFLLLGVCTLLQAQDQKEINEQHQFWTSINTTIRASNHWGGVADFHVRRNNFMADPSFWFLRFGGAYFLDRRFSFVAGYAHLWLATETNNGLEFQNENRLYQQALWRVDIERTTFLQRVRTEQRWQNVLDEEGNVSHTRLTHRARFLISLAIRIFNNKKLPRLVLSDEVHIQFGEEIVYNTFDQNRFFIGINQRINDEVSFDFGYMNVYQQKNTGYQYDMNHTLRLFFYYSPDFRKRRDSDLPHFPLSGEE